MTRRIATVDSRTGVRRGRAGACNSWCVTSDEKRPEADGDRLLVSGAETDPGGARQRRRERTPRLVAMLIVVVITAGLVALTIGGPEPDAAEPDGFALEPPEATIAASPSTTTTSAAQADDSTPGVVPEAVELAPGWQDLALLDTPRYHSTLIDIGDALIAYGGGSDLYTNPNEPGFEALWSGIAIDHATGRATDLPPSPLCPIGHPTAVWTGTELVVWGVVRAIPEGCLDAAAYNPQTGEWRAISEPRFFRQAVQQAAWTGTEIIDVRAGLAYDPEAGSVRDVPSVRDSEMFTGTSVSSPPRVHWTGSEFLALGSEGVIRVDPFSGTLEDGPVPPIAEIARGSAMAGNTLLAVNYDMGAAVFDPQTGEWSEAAELPLRRSECVPETASGDVALVRLCSGIGVWDGTGEWWAIPVPAVSGSVLGELATGGGFLYQVGDRVVRHSIDPETLAEIRYVPVGAHHVVLPEGWTLSRLYTTAETDPGTETSQTVVADVVSPEGNTCQIASTYQGMNRHVVTASLRATTVERVVDGTIVPAAIATDSDGITHIVVEDGSDVVDVSCAGVETVRFLAGQIRGTGSPAIRYPPGTAEDGICDVELDVDSEAREDVVVLTIQGRLLEGEPCGADTELWVRVFASTAGGTSGVSTSIPVEVDFDLRPGAPFLVVTVEIRQWCETETLNAAATLGPYAQAYDMGLAAPCADNRESPELVVTRGPELATEAVIDR